MALLELLVSVAIVLSSISGIGEFSSQFKYTLTLGVKLFGSFQKIMMYVLNGSATDSWTPKKISAVNFAIQECQM